MSCSVVRSGAHFARCALPSQMLDLAQHESSGLGLLCPVWSFWLSNNKRPDRLLVQCSCLEAAQEVQILFAGLCSLVLGSIAASSNIYACPCVMPDAAAVPGPNGTCISMLWKQVCY